MTETKKEYPKEPLFNEVLMYQGKKLKAEGMYKTSGDPYKLWQLEFKKGIYGFKCGAWDTMSPKSIPVKDLVEGKYYEVVYKLRAYTNKFGPQKAKEVILLKLSTSDKSTENDFPAKDAKPSVPVPLATPVQSWDDFAKEYELAMKDNPSKNPVHMLGAYIINHHAGQFKELVGNCKEHFKK